MSESIQDTSQNVIKEANNYTWKVDKDGKLLDEPVKFLDHAIDAARMAVYSYYPDKIAFAKPIQKIFSTGHNLRNKRSNIIGY
jgi:phage terminase large subunit